MDERPWRPPTPHSRTEDHTADVWIAGEGPDPSSLLGSMLGSLYLIVAEDYTISAGSRGGFEVRGSSPEEALVRFLSEALYLLEGEGTVIIDPEIVTTPEGEGLAIRLQGLFCPCAIPEGRAGVEVKAITYHGADLDIAPGRCSGRVLVDI